MYLKVFFCFFQVLWKLVCTCLMNVPAECPELCWYVRDRRTFQRTFFFIYLFNAFLQSTPSGAISKSGDGSGLGGEVVQ